jgi:hypothetical protein
VDTRQLMIGSFRLGGEPSDLNPYLVPGDRTTFDATLASDGAQGLLELVNGSVVRIANWTFPNGTILRFRKLTSVKIFQAKRNSYAVASGSVKTAVFPVSALVEVGGCYDGFTAIVVSGTGSGESAMVGSTVVAGGNVTLNFVDTLDTALDATSVIELARNWISFVDPAAPVLYQNDVAIENAGIGEILRVRGIGSKVDLEPKPRTEWFTGNAGKEASPTQYWSQGGRLYFDSVVPKDMWFEMLYIRQPEALVASDQELEIPLQFHEAVTLHAGHRMLLEQQDFNGAYALKRTLEEFMSTIRLEGSLERGAEELSLVLWG